MIHQIIPLPFEGKNATLTLYCQSAEERILMQKRPTVLVIPGGGYGFVSKRESECVALKFASIGYNAAVLTYSVYPDALFPQSLCEAALAVAHLKEHSEEYHINPDLIYTCGFSAGGHLALSLGVFWDKKWLCDRVGKDAALLRPAAQILCYPVVTNDPDFAHLKSFERILGKDPDPEVAKMVSLDNQISKNTPPTFLWTTLDDTTVPCENSLLLANALKKEGVPFEFHLYGWAQHGLSLADRTIQTDANLTMPREKNHLNPHVASWFSLCKQWLEFTIEKI